MVDEVPRHSVAWIAQSWMSFVVSVSATLLGVLVLPVDLWTRGYLLMGNLFMLGSTIALTKTVRDNHEDVQLRNRVRRAKTEQLLTEFERAEP